MRGSPLSKWDSRLLWDKFNYRDYGIAGEIDFDTNFSEVLYLTDTGRRWNGEKYSLRDKAGTAKSGFDFKSTYQIIRAAEQGILPA